VLITDSQLVAVSNANKKSNTNGKNGFPGDIMEAFILWQESHVMIEQNSTSCHQGSNIV